MVQADARGAARVLKTFCDRCERPGGSYRRFLDVQDDSTAFVVSAQASRQAGPVLELCDDCWSDLLALAARAAKQARPLTRE